jgi:hypothetical protein
MAGLGQNTRKTAILLLPGWEEKHGFFGMLLFPLAERHI